MTDPRNISPRSDAFLSLLGPYVSEIEHSLVDCDFLVKGIDLRTRDVKMSSLLDYDVFVETDYSRFDMTISYDWLVCVQDPLLTYFFPGDDEFEAILTLARKTHGVSECGYAYDVVGTRASGDAHTSIANGLINAFNTAAVYDDVPRDEWGTFHEGDDGILGLTESYRHLATRPSLMCTFGFKVKVLIADDLNAVTFCGRYLSETSTGLVSYADPLRTLSKLHITISQGRLDVLLCAKVMSYLYTDSHTPILGPVCQALRDLLRQHETKALKHVKDGRFVLECIKYADILRYKGYGVDERLRAAFCLRTGIPVAEQLHMENYYTRIFSSRIPASFGRISAGESQYDGEDRELHWMPTLHA